MVVNIQNDIDIRHESQTDNNDETSPLINLSIEFGEKHIYKCIKFFELII